MQKKPVGSLSLDLDNLWTYMKIHSDPGWETFPSYLDIAIPRILDFLKARNLVITFFIVGQDAALEKNKDALTLLAKYDHEIGHHSFNHEPWLHTYSKEQVESEIIRAEEVIQNVTGRHPIGFRGPGFSVSQTVLDVLAQRGYQYDASTLPSYLGPLARAYYFMTTKLEKEEKKQRQDLYGSIKDGFKPLKPYLLPNIIEGKGQPMVEIPVTTIPIFKIPFHVSYILYIASYSHSLALLYFKFAMRMCQLTNTQPSLLLHSLDFLGKDDVKELAFFPAMNVSKDKKLKLVSDVLSIYSEFYEVVPLREFAREAIAKLGSSGSTSLTG